MAEINTSVWGDQEDWMDASYYYEQYQAPLKDRIQWASYDGEHSSIYDFIHGAATLEPNTPIDNSICYCGLGTESPLSHITYFRGQVGYSYRFRGSNVPWSSAEANTQEVRIYDNRTITNFALSHYSLEDGNQKNVSKQYFDTNRYLDYFHQGWGPSSVIDTITSTTGTEFKNNPTLHTQIPVRLPVKNMVAIPYVKAMAHVGVESPDSITLDLKTYLDTTAEHNYTTHPYMYQVCMVIYSDPSGVKETGINRSIDTGFNQLMLLEDISMWEGMPNGTYELHEYGQVIDYKVIDYSHIISYDGQSGIPILGNLIGSWNKRYSGCEPIGDDENPDWEISELDWWQWENYEGHGAAGAGGPECFAWAGPDPSIAWYEPEGSDWDKYSGYKRFVYRQITDADAFREEVRSAVACFGLFFVDGAEDKNVALDSDKMMLGILEEGIGHGDYSHGEENRDQDQWNMDDAHDIDFDPANPPRIDPNDYDEDLRSELRVPLYAQIGGHTYITSGTKFQQAYDNAVDNIKTTLDSLFLSTSEVSDAIFAYNSDPTDANYEKLEKAMTLSEGEDKICKSIIERYNGLHTNPINCVCSILAFPFDLTNYISFTNQDHIVWGATIETTDNPASGDFKLVNGCKSQFWVPGGECSYFDEYQNFLDYTPYCSAELYIPYCGSVQIDPETFIGHNLSVRYLVDWHTGACLAFIYRDNLIVDQISGQMGISIPMIAADNLSYANSMFEGSQQLKHAKTSSIATTVSGLADGFIQGFKTVAAPTPVSIAQAAKTAVNSAASMANSWNDVKSAEYDLNTKQLAFKQLTTASPMTSTGNEQICRLVIYRPTFLDGYTKKKFGDYGHTTGFACLENKKLSGFTGLTVCSSVDLSGITQATEKEKAMISSALKGGVYIKATS